MKNILFVLVVCSILIMGCKKQNSSSNQIYGTWKSDTIPITNYPSNFTISTWFFNNNMEFTYNRRCIVIDLADNLVYDSTTQCLNGTFDVVSSSSVNLYSTFIGTDSVIFPYFPNDTTLTFQVNSDSLFLLNNWHHKQ